MAGPPLANPGCRQISALRLASGEGKNDPEATSANDECDIARKPGGGEHLYGLLMLKRVASIANQPQGSA